MQRLVESKKLQPVVRTTMRQTAFATPFNNNVVIELDESIRCHLVGVVGTCWCFSAGHLIEVGTHITSCSILKHSDFSCWLVPVWAVGEWMDGGGVGGLHCC